MDKYCLFMLVHNNLFIAKESEKHFSERHNTVYTKRALQMINLYLNTLKIKDYGNLNNLLQKFDA